RDFVTGANTDCIFRQKTWSFAVIITAEREMSGMRHVKSTAAPNISPLNVSVISELGSMSAPQRPGEKGNYNGSNSLYGMVTRLEGVTDEIPRTTEGDESPDRHRDKSFYYGLFSILCGVLAYAVLKGL
ncbi:MAG TPA: hypothetical protein VN980_05375, partial [Alphaproteobacteria bacterium]|nr:hypothetical protein [Alphaproteobacteria bacterium]